MAANTLKILMPALCQKKITNRVCSSSHRLHSDHLEGSFNAWDTTFNIVNHGDKLTVRNWQNLLSIDIIFLGLLNSMRFKSLLCLGTRYKRKVLTAFWGSSFLFFNLKLLVQDWLGAVLQERVGTGGSSSCCSHCAHWQWVSTAWNGPIHVWTWPWGPSFIQGHWVGAPLSSCSPSCGSIIAMKLRLTPAVSCASGCGHWSHLAVLGAPCMGPTVGRPRSMSWALMAPQCSSTLRYHCDRTEITAGAQQCDDGALSSLSLAMWATCWTSPSITWAGWGPLRAAWRWCSTPALSSHSLPAPLDLVVSLVLPWHQKGQSS